MPVADPATKNRRIAGLVAAALLALLALLPAAGARAASTPLAGWLGGGAKFPQRALDLFGPAGNSLTAANLHVTENGVPVTGLTVTPVSQARAGDFGVMVLIDRSSSMDGAPLAAAIKGVRSFAALRTAQQQLGLISFDTQPTVLLSPSSSAQAINQHLSIPVTGPGANVTAAIQSGLAQLAQARVALGAIVVISDGSSVPSSSVAAAAKVKAAAAAARVPIFTVGLRDRSTTGASLTTLASAAPGQFVQSAPAGVASVLAEVNRTITRGYVARWTSKARPGQNVNVVARADGVPGQVAAGYRLVGPSGRGVAHTAPAAAPHIATVQHLSAAPAIALTTPRSTPAPAPLQPAPAASFWASSAAVLVIAVICGLLFAMSLAFALYRPSKRAVRTRVGSFIPATTEGGEQGALAVAPKTGGGLAAMVQGGSWWPPFVENVEIARSRHTPVDLVKRAAIIGLVVAVLLFLISGSILPALVALLGWPFGLKLLIKRAAEKQRDKFRDTLPGYLQDLASAMRVGRSFVGGLAVVAESADEPVRSEIERTVTDESLGLALDASLEAVARRMQAPDVDQVALIAALNRRSGSNVAEALERVAEGARERAELRREIKALTAQGKMSSWVLTSLPGVLLLGVNVISPLYAKPLLGTTLGIILLCVGACMCVAGWKVMKKITTVQA